jgi:hypothetical protein
MRGTYLASFVGGIVSSQKELNHLGVRDLGGVVCHAHRLSVSSRARTYLYSLDNVSHKKKIVYKYQDGRVTSDTTNDGNITCLYLGFSTLPPVYPTLEDMSPLSPNCLLTIQSGPQKQPVATVATSSDLLGLLASLFLAASIAVGVEGSNCDIYQKMQENEESIMNMRDFGMNT